MEGLLTLFVALTALAVVTQAGVLVGIYLMSRRLSDQVDRFMKETRDIMVPLGSITENLRAASANIVEIGVIAREQFRRVEAMVTDTGEAVQVQLERFDRVGRDVRRHGRLGVARLGLGAVISAASAARSGKPERGDEDEEKGCSSRECGHKKAA